MALSVSMAETADLANGIISWGEAELNVLTSAVGSAFSWAGNSDTGNGKESDNVISN